MIEEIISEAGSKMQKTVDALAKHMSSLRAGHATPALVEHIRVDYHGAPLPLNQVGTVSVPEPRLLVIQPWDKTTLGAIERAIQKSDLGINPINDGSVIRLAIPPLTEERRKDLAKNIQKKVEEGRVSLRQIRRDALQQIKNTEKAKDISQDESRRAVEQLQAVTDGYSEKADLIGKAKEKEILQF